MHDSNEFHNQLASEHIAPNESKTMADRIQKLPENVSGLYYVDNTCIDCDLCRSTAPRFFTRHDENGYSYVFRQPVSLEEIAEAEAARTGCPTETIGNDG